MAKTNTVMAIALMAYMIRTALGFGFLDGISIVILFTNIQFFKQNALQRQVLNFFLTLGLLDVKCKIFDCFNFTD